MTPENTEAAKLGEEIKEEAGLYDCNYEALHRAVDRLVALAARSLPITPPVPAGVVGPTRVLGEDEIRVLRAHHQGRICAMLARADKYRRYLPDSIAAREIAEAEAEAERHRLAERELAHPAIPSTQEPVAWKRGDRVVGQYGPGIVCLIEAGRELSVGVALDSSPAPLTWYKPDELAASPVTPDPSMGTCKWDCNALAIAVANGYIHPDDHPGLKEWLATVTPEGAEPARDPHFGGLSYEASMLRDLLAVIHRDGGHYVAEYGLEKALADAQTLVLERRSNGPPDGAASEAVGWQPISTAPKDGDAEILAFKPGVGRILVRRLDPDHPDCEGEGWHESWSHHLVEGLTLFHSLPEIPAPLSGANHV